MERTGSSALGLAVGTALAASVAAVLLTQSVGISLKNVISSEEEQVLVNYAKKKAALLAVTIPSPCDGTVAATGFTAEPTGSPDVGIQSRCFKSGSEKILQACKVCTPGQAGYQVVTVQVPARAQASCIAGGSWTEVEVPGISNVLPAGFVASGDSGGRVVAFATSAPCRRSPYDHTAEDRGKMLSSTDKGDSWRPMNDRAWTHVALSRMGEHMLATKNVRKIFSTCEQDLFVSSDSGETWTRPVLPQLDPAFGLRFYGALVSVDGAKMLAFHGGFTRVPTKPPGVYLSSDAGRTWTEVSPDPYGTSWRSFAMTPNASKIVAATMTIPGARIWISEDFGRTWDLKFAGDQLESCSQRDGCLNYHSFKDVAVSESGERIIAVGHGSPSSGFPNLVMTSRDGGRTWQRQTSPAFPANWALENVELSADGERVILLGSIPAGFPDSGKRFLISSPDFGGTWNAPTDTRGIYKIEAVDRNLERLVGIGKASTTPGTPVQYFISSCSP